MDEDDIITPVLAQLVSSGAKHICVAAQVSRQFRRLAALDLFWRPLCERRWVCFPDGRTWLAESTAKLNAAASPGGAPRWRNEYARRARALVKQYPCFCMGSSLNIGEPIGLHLFEPRYRLLIKTAMEGDGRFLFPSGRPMAGQCHYLCEAHNVTIYPDGRADVLVLPVQLCRVKEAWVQPVGNHPPLSWATVSLLPARDPAEAALLDRLLGAMRMRLARHAAQSAPAEEEEEAAGAYPEEEDEEDEEVEGEEEEYGEEDDDDDDTDGEEDEGEEDSEVGEEACEEAGESGVQNSDAAA